MKTLPSSTRPPVSAATGVQSPDADAAPAQTHAATPSGLSSEGDRGLDDPVLEKSGKRKVPDTSRSPSPLRSNMMAPHQNSAVVPAEKKRILLEKFAARPLNPMLEKLVASRLERQKQVAKSFVVTSSWNEAAVAEFALPRDMTLRDIFLAGSESVGAAVVAPTNAVMAAHPSLDLLRYPAVMNREALRFLNAKKQARHVRAHLKQLLNAESCGL